MMARTNDTIGGFNSYINTLKKDKDSTYLFSLTLFDTYHDNRHVAAPLASVPELTTGTYVPGGNTALFDAIGRTVAAIEAAPQKVDKVLTVILTDGEENSSREYTLQMIKDLISRKEKEGNWTFVFLGADLGAFAAGDRMGVSLSNAVAYNPQNVNATFATTASATMCYAVSGQSRSSDFFRSVPTRSLRAAGMSRRVMTKKGEKVI